MGQGGGWDKVIPCFIRNFSFILHLKKSRKIFCPLKTRPTVMYIILRYAQYEEPESARRPPRFVVSGAACRARRQLLHSRGDQNATRQRLFEQLRQENR